MYSKKILFITHDSSRSGAPMLLLYLLQWLHKKDLGWQIDVVTLRKGALDEDFKKVSNSYDFFYDKSISTTKYYKQKIFGGMNHLEYCENRFYKRYDEKNYDVIYSNSVVSIELGLKIKNLYEDPPKLICNVHELPTVIELTVPLFRDYVSSIDLFLGGSNLVSTSLQKEFQVPALKVKTFYDFTDLSRLPKKEKMGDRSPFTIGGMGNVHWRKGSDVFLMVAVYLKNNFPDLNINFLWIGSQSTTEKIILENDLIKTNLGKKYISFLDAQTDYQNKFLEMDVFFLASREDPFPLVAIEAGAFGLPIITFEKATGINEIIVENGGGGFIVPYLDIKEVSEKIVYYYNNREKMLEDSKLNQKVFQKFTVENAGQEFIEIMGNL